jgi:hypothetical protein
MLFYMELENHPIPQDITGFQFKLIGSMTIKQFAYLAGGFIFAWIFYVSPLAPFIKIPFAFIFATLGASFAFLPIGGRPMDVMLKNFIKAVVSPTQYIYQSISGDFIDKDLKNIKEFNKKRLSIAEMSEIQLKAFLNTLPKGTNRLDKKEMVFFQNLNQYQTSAVQQNVPAYVAQHAYANKAPQGATTNMPQMPQVQKENVKPSQATESTEDLQKAAALLEKELKQVKEQEATQPKIDSQEYLNAHQKVLELQKSQNDLLFQKQQLEEKFIQLQKQMEAQKQNVYSPTLAQFEPEQTKFVRSIPQGMTKSIGLPTAPEFPNIISGIVKDPRGNPLSNILVEVKDEQSNAVRAFKTNALGQFASATPLNNGNYTIEFEDQKGQNRFDTVGFKASNEIILPIEVISVDTREELRRSLFN